MLVGLPTEVVIIESPDAPAPDGGGGISKCPSILLNLNLERQLWMVLVGTFYLA